MNTHMNTETGQFTCECGKQFKNRNEFEKHRQNCASALGGGATKAPGTSASGQRLHHGGSESVDRH